MWYVWSVRGLPRMQSSMSWGLLDDIVVFYYNGLSGNWVVKVKLERERDAPEGLGVGSGVSSFHAECL